MGNLIHISLLEYPAFQKHILDSQICPIVDAIARNDTESYVRASALKCLKTMLQIKLFWDGYLTSSNLIVRLSIFNSPYYIFLITFILHFQKYFVHVLNTESEGIVRKEAVTCITSIYSHQQIEKSYLDHVFNTLIHAAVNDLYWEVKFNALMFWRVVVCRQFQHQGMIDGSFPTVTFSKEHKKIITLTQKEILLRLKKVLNELSLRGCLGVLLACLGDDCDLEVIKLTVFLVQKIVGFLNKYNYIEEFKKSNISESNSLNSPKPFVDTNYSEHSKDIKSVSATQTRNDADFSVTVNVSHPTTIEELNESRCSDTVIESIVNLDDMGLLATAYQNNLKINNSEKLYDYEIEDNLLKQYIAVTAEQFINFVSNTDLNKLIEEKTSWLQQSDSFSSLLDDIVLSFGYVDVDQMENEIDCY